MQWRHELSNIRHRSSQIVAAKIHLWKLTWAYELGCQVLHCHSEDLADEYVKIFHALVKLDSHNRVHG